jgi:hypothetical protein
MWGKTAVKRISRQPSPIQIIIEQKPPENVEYIIYLCSLITNDARRSLDIKSRISTAKAALNKKKILLTRKVELNLRKKIVKWC